MGWGIWGGGVRGGGGEASLRQHFSGTHVATSSVRGMRRASVAFSMLSKTQTSGRGEEIAELREEANIKFEKLEKMLIDESQASIVMDNPWDFL